MSNLNTKQRRVLIVMITEMYLGNLISAKTVTELHKLFKLYEGEDDKQ